jgi:methylmalonyl-CoA/ethylmalonyl-CoA epimerase
VVNGHFHHVGVACRDIERERRELEHVGYAPEGTEFMDPIQGIKGLFLAEPGSRLELVSPTAPGGVLQPWLDRGSKMYHLAFVVADLRLELDRLIGFRGRLVVGPVPAVAFGGRDIAFVMLPNMMLVELIQGQHE